MTIKYRRMAVFGIPWHPHPPHHLRYSHQKILAHYCFSRVKRRKGFAFQRTFWIFSSLFSFGSLIAEISAVSYATDLNFWSLKSFEICNRNHLFPLHTVFLFFFWYLLGSNRASLPPQYKHGVSWLSYSSDNFLQQLFIISKSFRFHWIFSHSEEILNLQTIHIFLSLKSSSLVGYYKAMFKGHPKVLSHLRPMLCVISNNRPALTV